MMRIINSECQKSKVIMVGRSLGGCHGGLVQAFSVGFCGVERAAKEKSRESLGWSWIDLLTNEGPLNLYNRQTICRPILVDTKGSS